MKIVPTLLWIVSLQSFAQQIEVNWSQICTDIENNVEAPQVRVSERSIESIKLFCSELATKDITSIKPKEFFIAPQGQIAAKDKRWKVTFYFGHAKTSFRKTNLNIEVGENKYKVYDVRFDERGGRHHFNPKNWTTFEKAFKWIDEPTNLVELSFQKGNHIIYISVFHPKHLIEDTRDYKYSIPSVADEPISLIEAPIGISSFQVTEWNLENKISYGYQLRILGKKSKTRLYFTPRASLGLHTSKSRMFHDGDWKFQDNVINRHSISIGSRLELKRARWGIFIDHGITRAKFYHDYPGNVKVNYNLTYSPITFGISFKVLEFKKKKKLSNLAFLTY